jgi:long-chain acyl-CoA synthetase
MTAGGLLAATFFDQALAAPDKIALCCDGDQLSYAGLSRRVRRWSAALAGRQIKRGEQVAVLLPNGIDYVVLFLVAANLGLVLVPLPLSLPLAALRQALIAADVVHLITDAASLGRIGKEDEHFLSHHIAGLCVSVDAGATTMADLLKGIPPDPEPFLWAEDSDPFILTMTSGSTGEPKPIILTQQSKFNRARAAIELYAITDHDVTLAATPLYHSLAERLVLIPLLTGGTSIVMSRFSPSEWIATLVRYSVSFTIAVSSQLRQVLPALKEQADQLSSIRCIVSSSALLEPAVKAELVAALRCDFHECYGASEIAIATNLSPTAPASKLSSVGTSAPGTDLLLLTDDDRPAAIGEIGEIVCKTPMLFGGYYRRPDLTRSAMWGEYFRTGDLGRLDEDGYLTFLGRKKDLIITGGINIYPDDIEKCVATFGGIREVAAFAIPDDRLGEIVGVAIVPDPAVSFDLRAMRHFCATRLADYQQPRKFITLDALPRTALGKLARRQLIDHYRASLRDS